MYLDFFGFSERPFSNTPDLHFLYLGKQHERALQTLQYGVQERLGFLLLTGEVGAGKTTLSRALLSRLEERVKTSLLVNPLLSTEELFKSVAKDFGVRPRGSTPQKLIAVISKFLLKTAEEGKTALLIIDESQNLSREALEAIRMLTNLETEKQKLLQILLVGQPELLKRLSQHDLRQVDQRIATRVHLEPLELVEMMRYINHRISLVGGTGKIFFDPKAYKAIHRESKGFPRLMNTLTDRALMAAYIRESYVIDEEAIDAALADWKGKRVKSFFMEPLQRLKRLVLS